MRSRRVLAGMTRDRDQGCGDGWAKHRNRGMWIRVRIRLVDRGRRCSFKASKAVGRLCMCRENAVQSRENGILDGMEICKGLCAAI